MNVCSSSPKALAANSYPGDCSVDKVRATLRTKALHCPYSCLSQVDMWPSAGANQMFKFIPAAAVDDGSQFQYYISAVGRATCPLKFLSFPVPCTSQSPDRIDLWDAAGPEQTFRLFPMAAAEPNEVMVNTDGPCADPFTWFDTVSAMYVQLIYSRCLVSANTTRNQVRSHLHGP